MKTKRAILFFLSWLLLLTQQAVPAVRLSSNGNTENVRVRENARDLIRAALEAMGGEAKIRA
ncbi:MAG TPA: hypothetical protein VF721_15535, partial [Pyrinomonadaceae bacterium]